MNANDFCLCWLVHSGRAPFMLKKSAKLIRSRVNSKTYESNFQVFSSSNIRTPMRRGVDRSARRSMYSTPTIEMQDAEKEEKENRNEAS